MTAAQVGIHLLAPRRDAARGTLRSGRRTAIDSVAGAETFRHYLAKHGAHMDGPEDIDAAALAQQTPLFTPADIAAVVQMVARTAVRKAGEGRPRLLHIDLLRQVNQHVRSITRAAAVQWIAEARQELSARHPGLTRLEADVAAVYGVGA
jgi:SpoVK/Ycf46/Vps4 family AAA+-type ATPase